MKLIIILFSFLISLNLYADCYEKVTEGYSHDSRSFFVYEALSEVDAEELNEDSSKRVLKKLLQEKVGCSEKSAELEFQASCKQLMPGRSWSKVCYLEADLGYFVIQMDMMEGAHVIFNRWD